VVQVGAFQTKRLLFLHPQQTSLPQLYTTLRACGRFKNREDNNVIVGFRGGFVVGVHEFFAGTQ
jgi:hypothetical protein